MKARTATERGYGSEHQALRRKWAPLVAAGNVTCHAVRCLEPDRWVSPHDKWDLGHTADRTAWTGPEHQSCNRADGARRGNAMRIRPVMTSWRL